MDREIKSEFRRPNILAMLAFEGADFWGIDHGEALSATDPIEAIEVYLDESILSHTGDVVGWLRDNEQFWTFEAYKRMGVGVGDRITWSECLASNLRDYFGEEHGNEDGDDLLSDADEKELDKRMRTVVDWYISRTKVYPCESLRSFTLDSADILELVQQLRPDWLNAQKLPPV